MIIALVTKISLNKGILCLGILTVASFCANIFTVEENSKFAFYFPLCRFWQMAVGGLIAFINRPIPENSFIPTVYVNNILSVVGFLGIFLTSYMISSESIFPGYWALVPTLSSAFIIQAGHSTLINKYILSNEFSVFIGKVSYPLYLWHWPFLVFSRLLYPEGSDEIWEEAWFMLLLAFLFSVFTYLVV